MAAEQAGLARPKGRDPVVDARSLGENADLPSRQLQAGRLCRDRLSNLQFQVDEYELLAGRIKPVQRTDDALADAREFLSKLPPAPGQTGHCELRTDKLFARGIDGLLEDIGEHKENHGDEHRDVFQSFCTALRGMSTMVEDAARPVECAIDTAGSERRAELEEIRESCQRIAHEPPQTFRDAIQLIWFMQIGVMVGDSVGLVCSGRLDRRLADFYRKDLQAGRITRERARELIEGIYFLTNDFWPRGGAFSVMVGGRDSDGDDITNDLSHLCLEAIRRTNLVYPTVGVCWHEGTPEALTSLAVKLISEGHTQPAFFNDEVVQKGLQSYGVPPEEACDYLNSTCVEISTCGSSNIWVASPYFSLCGILMDHIADIAQTGNRPVTYDEFVSSYCDRLGGEIEEAVRRQNGYREERRLYGRKPIQSVFTADCIERGRDIDDGGARYNWVECSFVGLANLVDSLKVIEEEVYGGQEFTFSGLKEVLDSNFAGHEALRQKFLNLHPKYGLNDPDVDAEIRRIMGFITSECANHKMRPGDAHFVPGTFCWVMHQRLGAECGATPDGRRAGTPFADGAGPAQGREKLGPTAAIQSVTSWDHTPLIGGSAFNMKFNKSLFDSPAAARNLRELILTFLRQGGFETQINVVDNAALRKAVEEPESYRDLVVRIGGYTDYFTRLNLEMQQEIIERTEYEEL